MTINDYLMTNDYLIPTSGPYLLAYPVFRDKRSFIIKV